MSNWELLQHRARLSRKLLVAGLCLALLGICVGMAQDSSSPETDKPSPEVADETPATASGVVFDDQNQNGLREEHEPGLPGVRVSNQRQVTVTGKDGTWALPATDDTTFFVVKPRGWRLPVNELNLPRFYYHHRPEGSPLLRFRGIAPTGELPDSIDFPLIRSPEPDEFKVVFFADPQPYNLQQVDWVANDVIRELVGTDAAFGVTLGDIVGNDLSLFEPMNEAVSKVGRPWFNVIGNHDLNFDAVDDADSDATFRRIYGPSYYSFDHGNVHFVALDNVHWTGRSYYGLLSKAQLDWLAEDLKHVPKDQLVVLMMHIPLATRLPSASSNTADRTDLYELIKDRRAFAIAGHMHMQTHSFFGKDDGWEGQDDFEHVDIVTVSGSWWNGDADDRGIPHATMRDGAPNGYMIATFKDGRHSLRFKAAGRDADYQMLIQAPDSVWSDRSAGVPVYANIFGGSPMSVVEWRVGEGDWQAMDRSFEFDPRYVEMARTQDLPRPLASEHLWKALLPSDITPGTQAIEVRTTDVYGQTFTDRRFIRVMDATRRPTIESIEPAVLTPGATVRVKCSHLPGHDIQLIVPRGAGFTPSAIKVVRKGDVLECKLPANLNAGKLQVRSDLMLSDPVLFELGNKTRNGLRAEYFKLDSPKRALPDFDVLTPDLIRHDQALDFADANAFALPYTQDFGVRWTGSLNIEEAGEYEFSLAADDRAQLWINGKPVLESSNDPVKLKLEPGEQQISVLYMQRGGEAELSLKWKRGDSEFAAIPAALFLLE